MRAQVEKKMAQKEKEKKEERLRELAKMARDRRAGIKGHGEKGAVDGEVIRLQSLATLSCTLLVPNRLS